MADYDDKDNGGKEQTGGRPEQGGARKLPTSGAAIAGFVISLVSIIPCFCLLALIGLIVSIIGLVTTSKKPPVASGQGFALAGTIISGVICLLLPIYAAIAIPSLLVAKKAGQETAVIANLKMLRSVQEQYRMRFGSYGSLSDLAAEDYIDSVLASGRKSGYSISMTGGTDTWSATAVPITPGSSGDRGFYVDASGWIRFSTDGSPPNERSTPLE